MISALTVWNRIPAVGKVVRVGREVMLLCAVKQFNMMTVREFRRSGTDNVDGSKDKEGRGYLRW